MLTLQRNNTKYLIVSVIVLAIAGCLVSSLLRYSDFDPPTHNRWGFGCDADVYWDLSGNLLTRHGFVDSPGMGHAFSHYNNSEYVPNVIRPPGYPFVLAIARILWNNIAVAYLLNYLIYISICVYPALVLTLVYKRLSRKWLFLFLITLVFSPVYLIYTQGVQSDTFAALTLIGFTYHFLRVQPDRSSTNEKSGRGRSLLHAGIATTFGALCLLTRPNMLLYVFPLLLLGAILSYRRFKPSLKLNMIIGLTCVAVLVVWAARNYRVMGRFSISACVGNNLFLNYVYYRVEPKDELYVWKDVARGQYMVERIGQGRSATEAESDLDIKLQQMTLDYVLARPLQSLRIAGAGIAGLFTFSYFDISDVMTAKLFDLPLVQNHYVDASSLRNSRPIAFWVLRLLKEFSLAYKLLLLFSFVSLPMLFWLKYRFRNVEFLAVVWISSAVFLIGTGLVISSGDRLRLPVHSLNNFFFIVCLIEGLELFRRIRTSSSG